MEKSFIEDRVGLTQVTIFFDVTRKLEKYRKIQKNRTRCKKNSINLVPVPSPFPFLLWFFGEETRAVRILI